MKDIKVEAAGGRVLLKRKQQTFVLPMDEVPALTRDLTEAFRAHTVKTQLEDKNEKVGLWWSG